MSGKTLQQKREYAELLETKKKLKVGLPHLYGYPWYLWAWEFHESRNKNNFLCSANQISKSSTLIRKNIHWATATELWPELWPTRPTQFWYLYPSLDVATIEFEEKWKKEFLPGPGFKRHPKYGWRHTTINKKINSIVFNTGVTIYFKSYEQDFRNLQTSSVYMVSADEEMPEDLYDELNVRRCAPTIDGYFNMVFTATLGQEVWRATVEDIGLETEKFPSAFKRQISMYDCLEYMDGSSSPWTVEKIEEIKRNCKSDAEIQRRVYGKFVVDKDKKYSAFSRRHNVKSPHHLPESWSIYSGVDVGGGNKSHPGAIIFVGVNKDMTEGRVFKGWRGDHETTTAGDILLKYKELRGKMRPVLQCYDWASKDFKTISERIGEYFDPAEKSQDFGEALLNTLFKNKMLFIYDDPELRKLMNELETLKRSTPKTKAKDDMIDALRYAVAKIPWNIESLNDKKKEKPKEQMDERERFYRGLDGRNEIEGLDLLESEFDEWNEAYEYYGYT